MRGEGRASSLAFFGGHDEDAAGDHGDLFAAALGALWLCSLVLRDALGAFELLLALCAAVLVGWHDLVSGTAGQARRRKGYTRTARVERDFFGGRPPFRASRGVIGRQIITFPAEHVFCR